MKNAIHLVVLFLVIYFTSCKKDTSSSGPANDESIRTIAGNGVAGYSGDGGLASSAEINEPNDIFVDGTGNIYIADYRNHRIRKINTSGVISTIVGNGKSVDSAKGGLATQESIGGPWGVTVDALGNIYISDNTYSYIRKVNTNGIISTIAGTGIAGYSGDGGPATSALIYSVGGIVVDNVGNVYFTQSGNNCIRKIDTNGIISTIAGNGQTFVGPDSGDGGLATKAILNSPFSLAIDGSGNIYVAEASGNRIRKINTKGIISTIAGNGQGGYLGDGGPAIKATLAAPYGVAVDGSGNIYIADFGNYRIREVNTAGIISTIAGDGTEISSGDGGPAYDAKLSSPTAIAVGNSGNVYVVDGNRIREIYK